MPDTKEVIGTEEMPYDPENPTHRAIIDAYEVIKMADEDGDVEPEPEREVTLGEILDAVKELTKTVGTLAKAQNEMKERHDKWIKAGKF
jgi:hypothetical protein